MEPWENRQASPTAKAQAKAKGKAIENAAAGADVAAETEEGDDGWGRSISMQRIIHEVCEEYGAPKRIAARSQKWNGF